MDEPLIVMPDKQLRVRKMQQRCPFCNAQAKVRNSVRVTKTFKHVYFSCENLVCGASWKSSLAIEAVINLPRDKPHIKIKYMADHSLTFDFQNHEDQIVPSTG